jgi:hypothetical protein
MVAIPILDGTAREMLISLRKVSVLPWQAGFPGCFRPGFSELARATSHYVRADVV